MTLRSRLVACTLAAWLAIPSTAGAQLAESRFDADTEGWLNVTLPYPSAVPPTILHTYVPSWLGGHLQMADPDGSGQSGDAQYWQAPAQFLGNRLGCYGDSLEFDIGNLGSGFGAFHEEDIVLQGGGITLVHDLVNTPPATLTHFGAWMSEADWHRDGLLGPAPTHAEFVAVLGAITQLFIRAEYQLGPDTQYLDNVVLQGSTAGVAGRPAAPGLSLSPAAPNPSAGATRVEFTLPREGRVDVSVFDTGGRRVAALADGARAAGTYVLVWDGRDANGGRLGAGLYWIRLSTPDGVVTRRLVRLD